MKPCNAATAPAARVAPSISDASSSTTPAAFGAAPLPATCSPHASSAPAIAVTTSSALMPLRQHRRAAIEQGGHVLFFSFDKRARR
jgi:hypothetical protein